MVVAEDKTDHSTEDFAAETADSDWTTVAGNFSSASSAVDYYHSSELVAVGFLELSSCSSTASCLFSSHRPARSNRTLPPLLPPPSRSPEAVLCDARSHCYRSCLACCTGFLFSGRSVSWQKVLQSGLWCLIRWWSRNERSQHCLTPSCTPRIAPAPLEDGGSRCRRRSHPAIFLWKTCGKYYVKS